MRAVADSGPLVHLAAVNQFGLLRHYFSHLLVPPAVFAEVVQAGQGRPGSQETQEAQRSEFLSLAHPYPSRVATLLQQGMTPTDAQVVALAQENPDHLLLADDLTVRITALALGMSVFGTIGILIQGKRDGHLPSLKAALDQLIVTGFHLDPHGALYAEALHRAGES